MNLKVCDWLFVAGVIILILFNFIALIWCRKYPIEKNCDEKRRYAIKKRNALIGISIVWISIYYWMILNSILTTLIVLYLSCYENMGNEVIRDRVFLYSAVSLFSSVCPYVVNMQEKADEYREAYRKIERALVTDGDVGEAIADGEDIIK